MADTATTHIGLIKQDPNTKPDYTKDDSNLDKLDAEIWKRGQKFNGQNVDSNGEFTIRSIPYAENLETSASQKSIESHIGNRDFLFFLWLHFFLNLRLRFVHKHRQIRHTGIGITRIGRKINNRGQQRR